VGRSGHAGGQNGRLKDTRSRTRSELKDWSSVGWWARRSPRGGASSAPKELVVAPSENGSRRSVPTAPDALRAAAAAALASSLAEKWGNAAPVRRRKAAPQRAARRQEAGPRSGGGEGEGEEGGQLEGVVDGAKGGGAEALAGHHCHQDRRVPPGKGGDHANEIRTRGGGPDDQGACCDSQDEGGGDEDGGVAGARGQNPQQPAEDFPELEQNGGARRIGCLEPGEGFGTGVHQDTRARGRKGAEEEEEEIQ